jgi:CRP-like cAMP-binding protein
VQEKLAKGDAESLRGARDMMPRLLADAERRGITLVWMAEIERRLLDRRQALEYLEAAAREFADRFDMAALEKCAAMAMTLVTREQFAATSISRQLEASKARMRPLGSMWEASSLAAIRPEEREWLAAHAPLRTLAPNEVLLREGDPSRNVFVIKSGLVAILIDMGDGNLRRVRYCYPGWLLGESSVLLNGATATATLRAHGPTEVFAISGEALKLVMAQNPALRRRIAATKHMHRLDSFFTTHEALGQLDVQVRDDVIECVQRIEAFEEDSLLATKGESPSSAFLVAKGEIALYDVAGWDAAAPPTAEKLSGTVGADNFFGMRDALHQAPAPLTAIARAGTTVAFFDAERLRAIAALAPEQATALLERLG